MLMARERLFFVWNHPSRKLPGNIATHSSQKSVITDIPEFGIQLIWALLSETWRWNE